MIMVMVIDIKAISGCIRMVKDVTMTLNLSK